MKFEVEVVNIKTNRAEYIYCGRGTALGNPFKMRNEADRDRVCGLYIDWFAAKIREKDPKVLELLKQIYEVGLRDGIVRIGCYCAPKRCHLDTVRDWLMRQHSMIWKGLEADVLADILIVKARIERDTGLRPPNPILFSRCVWDLLGEDDPNPCDNIIIVE